MIRAFPRNMCVEIWFVAQWAGIGRSVPVSLRGLAITNLAVHELEKGYALPMVGRERACRLERESVKIPTHSCVANLSRAVYMATSSARMIVGVSSVPLASM